MDEHESILINNTKAHLSVLKGELNVVNEKLSETLSQASAAQRELEDILSRRRNALEELQATQKRSLEIEIVLSSRERNLSENEHTLAGERSKFDSYRQTEIESIDKSRADTIADIASKQDVVSGLEAQINDLSEKVAAGETTLASINKNIERSKIELTALNQDLSASQSELDSMIANATKIIDSKKKEFVDLEAKVRVEQEKITLPMENLKAREEEVARKELNLTILKLRFEKNWKKLYPEQELIID